MSQTKIEWCDEVWNPTIGCDPTRSLGCQNCWAARMATRHANNPSIPEYEGIAKKGKWTGVVRYLPNRLEKILKPSKPKRIFVCSMSDLFHKNVSIGFIKKVFDYAQQSAVENKHTFMFLTKRPHRMKKAVEEWLIGGICGAGPFCSTVHKNRHTLPREFWFGVSASNQDDLDRSVPILFDPVFKYSTKFVSLEPLLGPIDIEPWIYEDDARHHGISYLEQVIVGGETGPKARPLLSDWARSIRDQCNEANTPFFFKHFGEWIDSSHPEFGKQNGKVIVVDKNGKELIPPPTDENVNCITMKRVGKKIAGRLLEGKVWEEFPNEAII